MPARHDQVMEYLTIMFYLSLTQSYNEHTTFAIEKHVYKLDMSATEVGRLNLQWKTLNVLEWTSFSGEWQLRWRA